MRSRGARWRRLALRSIARDVNAIPLSWRWLGALSCAIVFFAAFGGRVPTVDLVE